MLATDLNMTSKRWKELFMKKLFLTLSILFIIFTLSSCGSNILPSASISAGYGHSLAIKTDGSLWAWGLNEDGQLGDGTGGPDMEQITPVKIMDNISAVSAGALHTMAVKKDGTLWGWGNNQHGQIGDGTTENRLSPVKIMDNVIAVAGGGNYTLAIKSDHSLWAWGWNKNGQLGDGTTEDRLSPVKIMDSVTAIAAGKEYLLGNGHSMAIKTDGTLWTWGYNHYGQIGDGTTENRHLPVKIMDSVAAVAAGGCSMEGHSMALKTDGSLWTWGLNFSGQLGNGTRTEFKANPEPIKIMDSVKMIAAGDSCSLAVKNDNSLWIWGYIRYSPPLIKDEQIEPAKIMDSVAAAAIGERHTLILKTDRSLWARGENRYGQIGNDTYSSVQEAEKIMNQVKAP
jgi:alpha-tubulin suppressor-like RCC1 family protein